MKPAYCAAVMSGTRYVKHELGSLSESEHSDQAAISGAPEAGAPRASPPELTHPVVVVTDFDDGLILPEVPHGGSATGAGRRQDVLDLPVPGDAADVLEGLPGTHNSLSHP